MKAFEDPSVLESEAQAIPVNTEANTTPHSSESLRLSVQDARRVRAETAVLSRLDALIALCDELGLHALARHWRQGRRHEILKQRVHIVILGEFNHGKSSLINSLLGVKALDVGIVPTTQVESQISAASDEMPAGVELVHHNGQVEHIDWERWLGIRSKPGKGLEKIVMTVPVMAYDPATVFVDTPGLNEASLKREAFLKHTLGRADLLLFVLDGSQALTRTELDIIATHIAPLGAERIAFIINKCDRLDGDEWLEVCAHVETALFERLGTIELFMLSSKDPTLGDMNRLEARIACVVERSKSSRTEAAALCAIDELSMIVSGLLQIMRGLSTHDKDWLENFDQKLKNHADSGPELSALANEIEAFEAKSHALNTWVSSEMERFAKDFSRSIPREIDKASIDDIEDYLAAFIADTIQAFVQKLSEHCREQMSDDISAAFARIMPAADSDVSETKQPRLDGQIMLRETRHFIAKELSSASLVKFELMSVKFLGKVPILAGVIQNRSEISLKKRAKIQAIERIQTLCQKASRCLMHDVSRQSDNFVSTFRETGGQFYRHLSEMTVQLLKAKASGRDKLEAIDLIEASIYWKSAACAATQENTV